MTESICYHPLRLLRTFFLSFGLFFQLVSMYCVPCESKEHTKIRASTTIRPHKEKTNNDVNYPALPPPHPIHTLAICSARVGSTFGPR